MPVLSMFYGIIIRMYSEKNEVHNKAHIHAYYAEYEAVIDLDDANVLSGKLPQKQLALVKSWIYIHQDELKANWKLLSEGEQSFKIEPLK